MAGLALAPGGELRSWGFWRIQLAHQAPMLVAMGLMTTVLRSALGMLAIVAGFWVVALVRAPAARTRAEARELLVDLLAMALVMVVPLIHGAPSGAAVTGMTGMALGSLGGRATAAILVVAWVGARYAMMRPPAAREGRLRSLVSGSCCAVGLIAMLLI